MPGEQTRSFRLVNKRDEPAARTDCQRVYICVRLYRNGRQIAFRFSTPIGQRRRRSGVPNTTWHTGFCFNYLTRLYLMTTIFPGCQAFAYISPSFLPTLNQKKHRASPVLCSSDDRLLPAPMMMVIPRSAVEPDADRHRWWLLDDDHALD